VHPWDSDYVEIQTGPPGRTDVCLNERYIGLEFLSHETAVPETPMLSFSLSTVCLKDRTAKINMTTSPIHNIY